MIERYPFTYKNFRIMDKDNKFVTGYIPVAMGEEMVTALNEYSIKMLNPDIFERIGEGSAIALWLDYCALKEKYADLLEKLNNA